MRLLVFSDSHGRLDYALHAIKETGQVDILLHAGDHFRDGMELAHKTGLPVKSVVGNCDIGLRGPLELVIRMANCRFLITHGHLFSIYDSLDKLVARGQKLGVNIVIFGHTHVAQIAYVGGILLFNPGSISSPRDQRQPSYGMIDIRSDGIFPRIHRVVVEK